MSGDRDGNGNGEHPVRPGGDDEPQLDIDTAFAAIVAGWGNDPGGAGGWPEAEDVPLTRDAPEAPEARTGDRPPQVERPTQDDAADAVLMRPAPGSGPRDADPEIREAAERAEDEQGYVPPEPPPIPRGDLMTRLLWAGTLGGPLFLLLAAVAWRSAPDLLIAAAVLAFIGGFVALVVRMPHDRDEDDDDGAVV